MRIFKKINKKFLIQILMLIVFFFLAYKFNYSFHKICPFSVICAGPIMLRKLELFFSIGILVGIIIFTISVLFKRIFCDIICPLGILQKISFYINKITIKKNYKFNKNINRIFFIIKFMFLFIIIFMTFYLGKMLTTDICPIYFISNLTKNFIIIPAMISLIFILLLSFFINSFFCRYICPYSALIEVFITIFSKILRRKVIKKDKNLCINCKLCEKVCPMGIDITSRDEINTCFCINCDKCIEACVINKKNKKCLYY